MQSSSNSTKFVYLLAVITLASFGIWYFITYILPSSNSKVETEIHAVLEAMDGSTPQAYSEVYRISEFGEDALPTLETLLTHPAPHYRWAGVTALNAIAHEQPDLNYKITSLLKTTLHDNHDTVKLITAASLASLGDKEGIPILIELLAAESVTTFIDPPSYTAIRANDFLTYSTQTDVDFDYFTSEELKRKKIVSWNEWWENNRDTLYWNDEQGVFQTV